MLCWETLWFSCGMQFNTHHPPKLRDKVLFTPSSQQYSPDCSGLSASLRCARTSRIHRVLNPQPTGLKRSLTNSPDHTSRDTLGGPVSRLRGVRASCDTQWLLHGIRQQMLDRIGNLEVGLKHPSDVSEQV